MIALMSDDNYEPYFTLIVGLIVFGIIVAGIAIWSVQRRRTRALRARQAEWRTKVRHRHHIK